MLFVLYVFLVSAISIIVLVICFVMFLTQSKEFKNQKLLPLGLFAGIAGFILSLLFAIFTFEMLSECFEMVYTNQTYVDDLKELHGIPQT